MGTQPFTRCVDFAGSACKAFEGTKRYVSTGAVDTDHVNEAETEIVDFKGKPSRANLEVLPGDVLFAKMQGTKKILLIDSTLADDIFSTGFCGVHAKKGILTDKCLYYLLTSELFLTQKDKHCSGATQKAITNAGLSKIAIKIPGLTDQERIVNQLDAISNIITKRQQELTTLDDLIKTRFIELFGDPKLNPKGFPMHQLSEYIVFLTSGSRGWAQYCAEDGDEWFITIKNVKDCRISTGNMQSVNAPDNAEAKRTRVQEGDLLISITADLGRTGVVTKEIAEHGAYINQHLSCIRLNREALEPLYVAYFMESPAGKEQFVSKNQSAVKAGLNFDSINTLNLLVPPKAVQREFIAFVDQIDKTKKVVQKALDETQLLFDSLMQQYFGFCDSRGK
jgi:type I restriction enzyme S subunit